MSPPAELPPPPSTADLAAAAKAVVQTYPDDMAAKTPRDRATAAAKLSAAAQAGGVTPAEQFALLSAARDLLAGGGDVAGACEVVAVLGRQFRVDAVRLACDAAAAAGRVDGGRSASDVDRQCAVPALEATADAAVAEGRPDLAVPLDAQAKALAARSGDPDLVAEVTAHLRDRAEAQAAWTAASRSLGARGSDPVAWLAVGRFHCLAAGNWAAGLPMLAGGSDPALAAAARTEVGAGDARAGPLAAADAWWAYAATPACSAARHPLAHRQVVAHAAALYADACPALTGLAKARATQRLAQYATESASPTAGIVHRRVDVLRLADPVGDNRGGNWKASGGGVVSDLSKPARLALPYAPPVAYDLRVTFARTQGKDAINLCVVGGGRQFLYTFDGYGGATYGVSMIDNHLADTNATTLHGHPLENGRRTTALVRVRADALEVDLDGKRLVRYPTNYANLSLPGATDAMNRPDQLGLMTWASSYVFYSAVVTDLQGRGTALR